MSEWGEAMEMARDRWEDERAKLVAALKALIKNELTAREKAKTLLYDLGETWEESNV